MRGVVIGPDEHGDVLTGRALHQRAAHRRPRGEQAPGVGGQGRPDLVPGRRQVPQQDVLLIEPAPAVQVPLLARLAPQTAPHHAVADPELPRQRGPGAGPAQPLRVRGAEQQVPHQAFARRDLLVGQHVPRPHLQPARLHERPHVAFPVRAGPQVILDQHRLPVEQKTAVRRVRLQPLDEIVRDRHQAGLERGARQVPLAVPVGMRDQMKDQADHRA